MAFSALSKKKNHYQVIITNIVITNDLDVLSNGKFAFIFYIQVSELIQDLTTIIQSIRDFIMLSMEMIVTERYFTNRSYSFISSDKSELLLKN